MKYHTCPNCEANFPQKRLINGQIPPHRFRGIVCGRYTDPDQATPGIDLIGRFGLNASPVGAQAMWTIGDHTFLADVISVYHREVPSTWMLKVRHFNGEPMLDVALSAVKLLHRR